MSISQKMSGFLSRGSWIRKMFEEGARLKSQYGAANVFDFSLGNPILEPPAVFKETLRRIAASPEPGLHAYLPNAGLPKAREALAQRLTADQGLAVSAEEVIVTCGAAGALNVIFKALLDPGDEVLAPAPYFVEYGFYVDNHGGVLTVAPTRPDFSLDLGGHCRCAGAAYPGGAHQFPQQPHRPAVSRG